MGVLFPNGVGNTETEMINDAGAAYAGTCVRCSASICIPIGNQQGSVRKQIIEWDSPGSNLNTAIQNASDVLQFVLDNSLGYLTMFCMQMGLYRPDIEGTPMQAGEIQYLECGSTNGADASGNVRIVEKVVNPKLYIPFFDVSKNYNTVKSAFAALVAAGKIGQMNFGNAEKSNLRVSVSTRVNGCTLKDWEAKLRPTLSNIDTSAGASDGYLAKRTA